MAMILWEPTIPKFHTEIAKYLGKHFSYEDAVMKVLDENHAMADRYHAELDRIRNKFNELREEKNNVSEK